MHRTLSLEMPATATQPPARTAMGLLGVLLAVVVAAAAPSIAHAEFSEALQQPCTGAPVEGEGSSAQKVAQQDVWTGPSGTYAKYCAEHGHPTPPNVIYISDGSGCGLVSMGAGGANSGCSWGTPSVQEPPGSRNATTRFGGSDAPPTEQQKVNMEAAGSAHPGVVHVLPVAMFAVGVIVHFPEGCELENPEGGNANTTTGGANDPSGKATGDSFAEGTLRVHITAEMLEEIWDGHTKTWGQVMERSGTVHMTGTPTNALEAAEGVTECKNVPVRRIVRRDGSGTTFNFKAYLSMLPGAPAGLWSSAPVTGTGQTWPITTSENATPPVASETAGSENECTHEVSAHRICEAVEATANGVAKSVTATDGSIGYLDLATAHEKGFTITPKAMNGGKLDDTYWIPLQTVEPGSEDGKGKVGTKFVEPSLNPKLNLSTENEEHGANCTHADVRNVPEPASSPNNDPTLGNWANAIGTGSKDEITYPACGLTYDFAFQNDATAYEPTANQEAQARTVKDYLTAVASEKGQQDILAEDYGEVPSQIIEFSRHGVAAITWSGSIGSTPPPTTTTTTSTTSSGGGGGPPSNSFSVAGTKVKGKHIVLSLVLPGPGNVKVTVKGGGLTVSSFNGSVGGGEGNLELPISVATQNKIKKAKSGKLKVTITVTFTPTGGTAATHTVTLTLTKALISSKGKAGKHKKHKKKK